MVVLVEEVCEPALVLPRQRQRVELEGGVVAHQHAGDAVVHLRVLWRHTWQYKMPEESCELENHATALGGCPEGILTVSS